MSDKDTGGPAFPVTPTDRSGQIADTCYGMTLRDYLAAKALSVAAADELSNPTFDDATYKGTAVRAYLYADAMLAERAK